MNIPIATIANIMAFVMAYLYNFLFSVTCANAATAARIAVKISIIPIMYEKKVSILEIYKNKNIFFLRGKK